MFCASVLVAGDNPMVSRPRPSFDSLDEFATASNTNPIKDSGTGSSTDNARNDASQIALAYPKENCKLRVLTKEEVMAIRGSTTVWDG